MKKIMPLLGVVIFAVIFLVGNVCTAFAQEKEKPSLKPLCCIAGTYKGFHQDLPSRNCSEPEKGEFTMEIYQARGCDSKIWGKITDASGEVMEFEGTVKPGPEKCCAIEAKAENTRETVRFKAILCKRGRKWYSKDGKYVHSNGCEGEFKIKEI